MSGSASLAGLVGVLFFVSCAAPAAGPPAPDAGGGGAGGAQSFVSSSATVSSGGGSSAGIGGGGGAADAGIVDASACAPFVETYMPACVACLDAACCDVAVMCFAVHDCFGYASCQQNCPSAPDGGNACLSDCATLYPMPGPAFTALTGCLSAQCAGTCPY